MEGYEKMFDDLCTAGQVFGLATLESRKHGLLAFGPVALLPQIEEFVAAQYFQKGKELDGICVGWVGEDFKKDFLPLREGNIPELYLRNGRLSKKSNDAAIRKALGNNWREIYLGQYWEFLKTADRKLSYAAYVKNIRGVVKVVFARWHRDRLRINSCELNRPIGWLSGRRFLVS